jgi:hypothetical protein
MCPCIKELIDYRGREILNIFEKNMILNCDSLLRKTIISIFYQLGKEGIFEEVNVSCDLNIDRCWPNKEVWEVTYIRKKA